MPESEGATMWGEPSFDQNQFAGRRTKAVKATQTREGWDTPGIAHADFASMHIHRRKEVARRLPKPEWAMNDKDLRRVVLLYCEGRLYIHPPADASDAERLKAIDARAKAVFPVKELELARLLKQYNELSQDPNADKERVRRLAILVQNRDSIIQILKRGLPALVMSVVFQSYRLGRDSSTVAQELGIKPPMVRIWLYRMNRLAKGLSASRWRRWNLYYERKNLWPRESLRRLFEMRVLGHTVAECALAFGVSSSTLSARWNQSFGGLTVNQIKAQALRSRRRSTAWNENALRRLFVLRACGLTFAECGERFGRHLSVIQWVWKKHFGDLKFGRHLGAHLA